LIRLKKPAQEPATYVTEQGDRLVMRDIETHQIVRATDVKPAPIRKPPPKHFRTSLRELSNNGLDWHQQLHNIAMGVPFTPVDPITQMRMEPVVPSPDTRKDALIALMHMVDGKPVLQTEVKYAERDESIAAALRTKSDEQLEKIIDGEYSIADEKGES
jgi:hypothetical protein